jgi:cobalamin biosynthesis Mg chelatase CobN
MDRYTPSEVSSHDLQYELENNYTGVLSYMKSVDDSAQGAYDAGYYWSTTSGAPAAASSVKRGNTPGRFCPNTTDGDKQSNKRSDVRMESAHRFFIWDLRVASPFITGSVRSRITTIRREFPTPSVRRCSFWWRLPITQPRRIAPR